MCVLFEQQAFNATVFSGALKSTSIFHLVATKGKQGIRAFLVGNKTNSDFLPDDAIVAKRDNIKTK